MKKLCQCLLALLILGIYCNGYGDSDTVYMYVQNHTSLTLYASPMWGQNKGHYCMNGWNYPATGSSKPVKILPDHTTLIYTGQVEGGLFNCKGHNAWTHMIITGPDQANPSSNIQIGVGYYVTHGWNNDVYCKAENVVAPYILSSTLGTKYTKNDQCTITVTGGPMHSSTHPAMSTLGQSEGILNPANKNN